VVRIAGVVFAGEWFGQRAGEWVHDWAGFIVFVIVLGGVHLAATRLARREAAQSTGHVARDISLGRPSDECHVVRDMSESGGDRERARVGAKREERLQADGLPDRGGQQDAGGLSHAGGISQAGTPRLAGEAPDARPPHAPVFGALAVVAFAGVVAMFT